MPPIQSHSTPTTDEPWDADKNVKRLRDDGDAAYYRKEFAWQDPDADPDTKGAYKFPHHEVSADGRIGAANTRACSAVIAVLNGGRGGASIPDEDRKGVWQHVARHLRDAGKEVPELQSSFGGGERLALAADMVWQPASVDDERRTVEIVIYSGAEITRYPLFEDPYTLRLSLEDGHVRLERLNNGAPLLDSHNDRALAHQIGVVERAWVQDGQLRGVIRFSDRPDVEPIWRDVQAGIVRNVSVGALIWRKEDETEAGSPVRRYVATDWEPLEVSLVPVPADPHAVVLAADKPRASARDREEDGNMSDVPNANVSAEPDRQQAGAVDMKALREQIAREQEQIRRAVAAAGIEQEFADGLCARGVSLDEAKTEIFNELAERADKIRSQSVEFVSDEVDKRVEAMTSCVLHQLNPARYQDDPAADWRGMRLSRLAEECVRLAGLRRPLGPNDLVRLALTTADFPNVLANVAGKVLLDAYNYAGASYRRWTKQSTAPDFKTLSRVRIGEFPVFEELPEGGQIRYGSVEEGKEQYAIATYAKGVLIDRRVIINDDLGAIDQMFTGIGVQAAVLENKTVYTILNSNPNMSDGTALFHANHGNLAGAGGAISITTLDAGAMAMMKQKGLDGATPLNIAPRFLIVPVSQRLKAFQYTNVPQIIVSKQADVNPFAGQLEVITDAMLDTSSTTAWYLAADPNMIPTIEYAYLEGAQGPQVERVDNPDDTLGVKIKAWLDFGATAIDWRGLYKNPGA